MGGGNVSTGRGGAGNIGAQKAQPDASHDAATLKTPEIREKNYTTGRGGSGNIAKNDPERPEVARAAQDVSGPPERAAKYGEAVHWGRGGEGNVQKGNKPVVAGEPAPKKERTGSKGFMDAAKEGLNKFRRESTTKKE